MKPTAVILITIDKEKPEIYEEISLQQCFKVLGRYPIQLICPKELNIAYYQKLIPQASFDFIDGSWLSSYMNLNLLKVMPFLYKRYRQYDYILFHDLNSFVLKDELIEWCEKGYSYIGSPWLEGGEFAQPNSLFTGVGNGGFSLRKVADHLKAINSFSYIERPIELWQRFKDASPIRKPYAFFDIIERLTIRNNTHRWFNDWIGIRDDNMFWLRQEETFWGIVINRNFKWFSVPQPMEALSFSFEVQPQYLYELNDRQLPFGCHGWWKYGFEFWQPLIRDFGYDV